MNKFLMIKCPINPNFNLKMGHLGPNLTTMASTGPLLTQNVARKGLRTF